MQPRFAEQAVRLGASLCGTSGPVYTSEQPSTTETATTVLDCA
jgi:hypothetical protein